MDKNSVIGILLKLFAGISPMINTAISTTNRRGRGRPRSENPRTAGFVIRLNPDEMKAVTAKARAAKKVRAEWVRDTILAA